MATKKNMPDAAMPLGDKRSYGMGMGVDAGPEHGQMMNPMPPTPRSPRLTSLTRFLPPAP